MYSLFSQLPGELAALISGFANERKINLEDIEEIRLRAGKNIVVRTSSENMKLPYRASEKFVADTLNRFTDYSHYAFAEQLSEGFITLKGGHRVGVCGRCVADGEVIKQLRNPSSLNIRQAKEVKGCADGLLPHILKPVTFGRRSRVRNTLIASPPKCGKTTLLRDAVRQLSNMGLAVSVCDERCEIAGMRGGIASFDIGDNTDVLDCCSKALGISLLLRSMAPEVIATDEIGSVADIKALEEAACCGVSILATMHVSGGSGWEESMRRVPKGIFERIVLLSDIPRTGTVSEIRCVGERS